MQCIVYSDELSLGCCGSPGAVAAKGVQWARQGRQLVQAAGAERG